MGRQQALKVRHTIQARARVPKPQLVVVSPLSGALETAQLVFPDECHNGTVTSSRFVCLEQLREINGLLLNGKRRTRDYLEDRFPHCNFQHISPGPDNTWTEDLENSLDCANRGFEALRWVVCRVF